jgi:hypothetical protein
MRRLAGDSGVVLVNDPKAGETFADDLAAPDGVRGWYSASVLHCLPVCMSEQPSAGTGTIMRPDTLRDYAREAGFRDVEILPIEIEYGWVYQLIP